MVGHFGPMESGEGYGGCKMENNRAMGRIIGRLLAKEDLKREEAYDAFRLVLDNRVTEMQQGAFLAALTAKGETAEEVAGGWQAIYELDTCKVHIAGPVVDNCGTGMDSFKTFNISTAASLVGAAGGVTIARHGARAITSSCGTVDMAEALGVDVECEVDIVARSVREVGIGLFNGMSGKVHPMALGRILSQVHFGSPLNIAASLAHPAMPTLAVRGVYSRDMVQPVAEVMRAIGYREALVVHGTIEGSSLGMDEASPCGPTHGLRLSNGDLRPFSFTPADCGLACHPTEGLAPEKSRSEAASNFYKLLGGQGPAVRRDAVILNSALIFLVAGQSTTLSAAVERARAVLDSGAPQQTLQRWVEVQNRDGAVGRARLQALAREAL
jgi:anthranilate phosphoribosyltransferase